MYEAKKRNGFFEVHVKIRQQHHFKKAVAARIWHNRLGDAGQAAVNFQPNQLNLKSGDWSWNCHICSAVNLCKKSHTHTEVNQDETGQANQNYQSR